MEDREWFWVSGPDRSGIPEAIGGTVVPHLTLGGIKFRHEPVRAPISHEIAGRMHPVAQISEYGHTVRGRCFVSNGMRLVLPSIGKYSAGANVLDQSFDPLLGNEGVFVWMVSSGHVRQIASGQLLEEVAARPPQPCSHSSTPAPLCPAAAFRTRLAPEAAAFTVGSCAIIHSPNLQLAHVSIPGLPRRPYTRPVPSPEGRGSRPSHRGEGSGA